MPLNLASKDQQISALLILLIEINLTDICLSLKCWGKINLSSIYIYLYTEIFRGKTMEDKLIYVPNDDTQNHSFFKLKLPWFDKGTQGFFVQTKMIT